MIVKPTGKQTIMTITCALILYYNQACLEKRYISQRWIQTLIQNDYPEIVFATDSSVYSGVVIIKPIEET